jgi:hypothetical protein
MHNRFYYDTTINQANLDTDTDKEFSDLQNKLQRHTRCAVGSCLVIDKKTKQQVRSSQINIPLSILTSFFERSVGSAFPNSVLIAVL